MRVYRVILSFYSALSAYHNSLLLISIPHCNLTTAQNERSTGEGGAYDNEKWLIDYQSPSSWDFLYWFILIIILFVLLLLRLSWCSGRLRCRLSRLDRLCRFRFFRFLFLCRLLEVSHALGWWTKCIWLHHSSLALGTFRETPQCLSTMFFTDVQYCSSKQCMPLTIGVNRPALLSILGVIRVRDSLLWKRASLAVGASGSAVATGPFCIGALGLSAACLLTWSFATDLRRDRKALRLGWCISGSSFFSTCWTDFVWTTVFVVCWLTTVRVWVVCFIAGEPFPGLALPGLLFTSLFSNLFLKAFTPLAGEDACAAFSRCITLLSLLTRKLVDGGGLAKLRRRLRSSRIFVPLSFLSSGFSTLAKRTPGAPSFTSREAPGGLAEGAAAGALLLARSPAASCSRCSRFSFNVRSRALIWRRSDRSRVDSS